ncbi:MAG: methyltransferase [Firmicutes bacterium]|nr:methyltransferase [Bacillota bacterium]
MIGLSENGKVEVLGSDADLHWHEHFIAFLAAIVKPKIYVELGLNTCTLFNRIIPYAAQLIGLGLDSSSRKYMQMSAKTRFIYADTKAFAQYLSNNPIQIDMLAINAGHSKNAIEQDFEAYFPFVASDGIIILHDNRYFENVEQTDTGCRDGCFAIDKLFHSTDEYEILTIPVAVPPGLKLCKKRMLQLA